jgi:hypothetical protein
MIGDDSSMRPRHVFIVLIALAAASTDVIALHFSLDAMACCAKAHNECAGFSAPDDCCKGMGHGVSAAAATMPTACANHVAVTLAILPTIETPAAIAVAAMWTAPTFKRPHDPPHLHPVPLLI